MAFIHCACMHAHVSKKKKKKGRCWKVVDYSRLIEEFFRSGRWGRGREQTLGYIEGEVGRGRRARGHRGLQNVG